MAEETKDEVQEEAQVTQKQTVEEMLVGVLGKLAERQDEGPIKQIPIAKAKYRTPWNPTGAKRKFKLKRATFLNGFRLRENRLHDETIQLLNQLKAGKYQNRKWVVVEADGDQDNEGMNSTVSIWIPNKTVGDRLKLAELGGQRGLPALLELIIAEQSKIVLA